MLVSKWMASEVLAERLLPSGCCVWIPLTFESQSVSSETLLSFRFNKFESRLPWGSGPCLAGRKEVRHAIESYHLVNKRGTALLENIIQYFISDR